MTFLLPSLSQITWHTVTTIQGDNVGEGKGGAVKGQAVLTVSQHCLQPRGNLTIQHKITQRRTKHQTCVCFFKLLSCWIKSICASLVLHSFTPHKPTHPLGELRVHHEVVYVFLGLGQLQLPGYHCNHQRSATSSLLCKDNRTLLVSFTKQIKHKSTCLD